MEQCDPNAELKGQKSRREHQNAKVQGGKHEDVTPAMERRRVGNIDNAHRPFIVTFVRLLACPCATRRG